MMSSISPGSAAEQRDAYGMTKQRDGVLRPLACENLL